MFDVLEAQKRRPAMKKISTVQVWGNEILHEQKQTIGVDLGDRWSFYWVLDEAGKIILEQKVATTPEAMKQACGKIPRGLIALETGTHAPWASRLLTELGQEVLVAHAQKVERITKSNRKDDRRDARTLARLARMDPELLGPVRHRSAQGQIHLTVIRARAELVSVRTALVNAARGLVKSYGQRLPKCGTYQVSRELAAALSTELRDVLEPLLQEIESLNERIKEYDERMEKIAKEVYPEVFLLKQVKGVGTQIALTYVLTIEDPYRFAKSREVGCFLGLKPGRRGCSRLFGSADERTDSRRMPIRIVNKEEENEAICKAFRSNTWIRCPRIPNVARPAEDRAGRDPRAGASDEYAAACER